MPYSAEYIRKAVKDNRRGATLAAMKHHQNRIKFHVVRRVNIAVPNGYEPLQQFLTMASNILPEDKFTLFKTLFRFPVKTNEITGVCFDKLSRIFDGRNPAFNYQFASKEQSEDWEDYRRARLGEPSVWETRGWEFFKSEINSVLVVDLSREQSGELPEPYFYWLTVDRMITYEADPITGQMRFIVFRHQDDIVAIDDASYRIWAGAAVSDTQIGDTPSFEAFHDLGYCPARFFWDEALSLDEPDVKASPLSSVLASLDWYEFFAVSKKQLDLYGAYPILSGYEPNCDFNTRDGDVCDHGLLKDREGHYRFDASGLPVRCPKCGRRRVIGAGSFIEIPVPNENEGQPDLRNPVQMLSVDGSALDYNVRELERLREEIITTVVGQDETVTNRDAYNEQQVQANFESVTTVLNRIKRGFEAAQQWVDETVCRLRYGKTFISARVNLGTQFYLYNADELRGKYQAAKEAGASEAELDALHAQIIETEYRNDPTQLRRMMILSELEPYRHLTRDEVISLNEKGIITDTDLRVKLNFANYIRRFERENINVLQFGSSLDYDKRIGKIAETLRGYAEAEAKAAEEANNNNQ